MHGRRVVCRQGKDLRQDNLCPIQSRVEWHHIASRVCSSLIYSQFSSKPTLKPADLPATFQICQAAPADVRSAARMPRRLRSEEHTSELQSLMRISYAVFCLKKKNISKIRQNIQLTKAQQSQKSK